MKKFEINEHDIKVDEEIYDYEKGEFRDESDKLNDKNYEGSKNADLIKTTYKNIKSCKIKLIHTQHGIISILGVCAFFGCMIFGIVMSRSIIMLIATILVALAMAIIFYFDRPFIVYVYKIKGRNYIFLFESQNDITYYYNNIK